MRKGLGWVFVNYSYITLFLPAMFLKYVFIVHVNCIVFPACLLPVQFATKVGRVTEMVRFMNYRELNSILSSKTALNGRVRV